MSSTVSSGSENPGARTIPGAVARAEGTLSPAFYQLTVVMSFLVGIEIRLRLGPSFALLELVTLPALGVLVAEAMLRPSVARRTRDLFVANRMLTWYVGWALLAAVIGLSRSSETLRLVKDILPGAILFAYVLLTATTLKKLWPVLLAHLAGAVLSVMLAVAQVVVGGPYLIPLSENIEGKMDLAGNLVKDIPTGLFAHPNGLALFLMPLALFLSVAVWPGFGKVRSRSLSILMLFAAILFVLKKGYVKGVYVWLLVGGMFIVLPRWLERARTWLAIAMPIVGAATLTTIALLTYMDGEPAFGTILSRIDLWLAAVEVIRRDDFVKLFGGGGTQLMRFETGEFEYPNAHNAWINQALTYGIPALIFYLGAYWSAFFALGRRIRESGPEIRGLAIATMASLVALLGENFFEPSDRGTVFQAQLFLLFALTAVLARGLRENPT